MVLIHLSAIGIFASNPPKIFTIPSDSISILVFVLSIISLITLPPVPMTAPILSVLILKVTSLGTRLESSLLGWLITFFISPKICKRPSFACARAVSNTSRGKPLLDLISIWIAVMPSSVPVTLKSIKPKASSNPEISERTVNLPAWLRNNPMATPPTIFLMGTPACINAIVEPHVVAIDVEPSDSSMSATIRIV